MEFEVSYNLENAQQFWTELDDILSVKCDTHELIDNVLRSFLAFTTRFKDDYLRTEQEIAHCSYRLLASPIFGTHADYVRHQVAYALLQEDEGPSLNLIAAILLYEGRVHEETFELLQQVGAFPRLVELIQAWGEDPVLHRALLDLMYEMSRIQRLTWEDLSAVTDAFVIFLFGITESLSSDVTDPYHYPVIRVLLVLNEQYIVSANVTPTHPTPLTNRVLKALSTNLSSYKTFGENLILLLNRESETSLQLLILKLLYMLFSSSATAEYFYTNDLHVLLDVILRNLLDLPAEEPAMQALRHTYLRVLFPLLANSQLRRPGMAYKQPEIRQVLRFLAAAPSADTARHFAPADPTTVRLAARCCAVDWIRGPDDALIPPVPAPAPAPEPTTMPEAATVPETSSKPPDPTITITTATPFSTPQTAPTPPAPRSRRRAAPRAPPARTPRKTAPTPGSPLSSAANSAPGSPTRSTASPSGIASGTASPHRRKTSGEKRDSGDGRREVAYRTLGMSLPTGAESGASVAAVAGHMERPGVKTPSRGGRGG
ncbi:hypothetical protein EJ06DRAFT_530795 [Trichodelitschia bisporula]|uniref:SPIN90/Ldb17 leucine-rich domain-containing protein n=1 Tax=Trichodelitschia bisporula TaxID=703511 RepID=A0A6G1HW33_9PEZI|nr:hypothetical protein EJ06DRAFT_530795 [Trichodelitschia bisporula]